MNFSAKLKYIGLTLLFAIASINFTRTTFEIINSSKRLDTLKGEVLSMEQEKSELEKSIEHKRTDDYVEERARDDLNMVKPGEKVFVVVGSNSKKEDKDDKNIAKSSSIAKRQTSSENNLSKWYRLFF